MQCVSLEVKILSRDLSKLILAGVAGLTCLAPPPCRAQATSYTISTYAGNFTNGAGYSGDGSAPTNGRLNVPIAVALDSSHNLYIADTGNDRIRKISNNKLSTIAGVGTFGYAGDGAQATLAELKSPYGVAVDAAGNVYISDLLNQVVRQVNTKGVINTFAGNNLYGYFGDGVAANSTSLNQPVGLALDAAGNLYIADSQNDRIRSVTPGGVINSVAGGYPGWSGNGGDGGPAVPCNLGTPLGVTVDGAGNVYIADSENHRIRKVTPGGIISTVVGTGVAGNYGDGGPAIYAQLNRPWAVVADAAGDLFIADYNNSRIRMVNTSGVITTIAGGAGAGYSGDGGLATLAMLNFPTGLALDTNGNIYIADASNNVIRLLTPTTPSIAAGGVVSASGFGGFSSIAPGSWIEIYGTNLALDSRAWKTSDFQGNNAPTSLDGVTVTVGGQPAYVEYISGGQINVQVPFNVSTGQQQVVVKNPAGTTASFTVTVNSTQPGMFAPSNLKVGGIQYAGALFLDGATFAIPPGAVAGVPSQRAAPGQTIVLYGVGFGSVSPSISAGQIETTANNSLTLPLQVSIGGAPATVTFGGLAPGSVGLYQFNVTVPNIPANDRAPLTFSLGGTSGVQTLYIAVQ